MFLLNSLFRGLDSLCLISLLDLGTDVLVIAIDLVDVLVLLLFCVLVEDHETLEFHFGRV